MAKECGSCCLCCKLPGVFEVDKPVNKWCKFAKPGKGCGVYDARPNSCRAYKCVWLQVEALPPQIRPDRCGVIFEATPEANIIVMRTRQEDFGTVWRKPDIMAILKGLLTQDGNMVVLTDGVRSQLFKRDPRALTKWVLLHGTRDLDKEFTPIEKADGMRQYKYSEEIETGSLL